MISITTKTGDAGETSLASDQRLPKTHPVFDAIGTVDELNSWLGLLVAEFEDSFSAQKTFLLKVQDTLFYLGAELAQAPKTKLNSSQLKSLESQAQKLEMKLKDRWHTKFLLPGGTNLAAKIDIARSVCRRCERSVFALSEVQETRPLLMKYLNRLSDYLYLLRTAVNARGEYGEKEFEAR